MAKVATLYQVQVRTGADVNAWQDAGAIETTPKQGVAHAQARQLRALQDARNAAWKGVRVLRITVEVDKEF